MKIIIAFFIFCLVLFVYLHIQFHLKTSNDLEMYEVDQASKDKLEEICDIRQPVLFDFENNDIMETCCRDSILNNYHAFEVKIRNTNDTNTNSEMYMPLPLRSAIKLFDEDKSSCYFTENNNDFLQETALIKHMRYNDVFLRPYMVSNCNYDILLGSDGCCLPFRYEINYRNYFLLTQGSAQIKLACPQNVRYLYPEYDYENFEFRSPLNPWSPQPKYSADFDKMKFLEFTLLPGKTLYIPAFWWYSIKFGKNTSISCFHYRTYMNNLAISPYIAMHALQIQNIKRKTTKNHDIKELNVHTKTNELSNVERKEAVNEHSINNTVIIGNESTGTIETTNIYLLPSQSQLEMAATLVK